MKMLPVIKQKKSVSWKAFHDYTVPVGSGPRCERNWSCEQVARPNPCSTLYSGVARVLPERVGLEWVSYDSSFEVLWKQFSSVICNGVPLLPVGPGVESLEIFSPLGEALSK